ncbi:hypothetical protein PAXINDRAFT_11178 [Paxillus involutus ATCC 200175]|nr:hypothetical protein PAXINDRAFT_11178 [Paxillus involutus ATCC 200175]
MPLEGEKTGQQLSGHADEAATHLEVPTDKLTTTLPVWMPPDEKSSGEGQGTAMSHREVAGARDSVKGSNDECRKGVVGGDDEAEGSEYNWERSNGVDGRQCGNNKASRDEGCRQIDRDDEEGQLPVQYPPCLPLQNPIFGRLLKNVHTCNVTLSSSDHPTTATEFMCIIPVPSSTSFIDGASSSMASSASLVAFTSPLCTTLRLGEYARKNNVRIKATPETGVHIIHIAAIERDHACSTALRRVTSSYAL